MCMTLCVVHQRHTRVHPAAIASDVMSCSRGHLLAQVFDSNNNGRVDYNEWQRGLGDLGAEGEGAKR